MKYDDPAVLLAAATVFGGVVVALPVAVIAAVALRLRRTRQKRQTHP